MTTPITTVLLSRRGGLTRRRHHTNLDRCFRFDDVLAPKAKELQSALNRALCGRFVQIDNQQHLLSGRQILLHLQKGAPLRLELGEKEYAVGKVKVVQAGTPERRSISHGKILKTRPPTP